MSQTVNISVTFSGLHPEIQRHLSVIGKRLTTQRGDNQFSVATLSSAELPIIDQYMQQGAQNVVAAIEDFVTGYTESSTQVSFSVVNTRWSATQGAPSFWGTFSKAFNSYLVNYALAEYLDMTLHDRAEKYYASAAGFLQTIVRLVVFKAPPAVSDVSPIASASVAPYPPEPEEEEDIPVVEP